MKKLLLLLASMSVLFSPAIFALEDAEIQDPGTTTSSVVSPSLNRENVGATAMKIQLSEAQPSSSGAGIIGLVLQLAVYIFFSYCMYLLATKLGEEDTWLAFVPIFGTILLFRMAKMSLWWILGLFIPFFNIYVGIKVIHNGISLRTGNSALMTVGLIFLYPIVMPIVAFTYKSEIPSPSEAPDLPMQGV